MNAEQPVIVGAARTAIGAFSGVFQPLNATDLGAAAIAEAVRRARLGPDTVTDVIMGNVLQAGVGQHPARQCAIKAGLPKTVNALAVNKVCGSGLAAVALAAQAIRTGDAAVVVAGGTESMSQAPYLLDKARQGYRLGDGKLLDVILHDGLMDAYAGFHMGSAAETIAARHKITRQEQDDFAFRSQAQCSHAARNKAFVDEIVAVKVPQRKGDHVLVDKDEYPKPDTSLEGLARLKPAFVAAGTVTAGNASGINDGAAAVVVTSAAAAGKAGLAPLAEIVAVGTAGGGTDELDYGPARAAQQAVQKAGLSLDRIGLFEINEAFAVQTLATIRLLGCAPDRVNVQGGAIALGHPIGASGARVLVTLLYAMRRRSVEYGLAALCIGGGEGIAMIIRLL